MGIIERLIKNTCHSLGFDVRRIPRNQLGIEPFSDIKALIPKKKNAVIFDVGANKGQSVIAFKRLFKDAQIHSFEPGENAFHQLKKNIARYDNVTINHFALGGQSGNKNFIENTIPEMSSFLYPSQYCWGEIAGERTVEMQTLDEYCERKSITSIDILKSDTQGFELEVLKGGKQLLKENGVHLVFMEIIMSDMYKNLSSFDSVYKFMIENNFKLVSFYNINVQDNLASWLDALFVNPHFS